MFSVLSPDEDTPIDPEIQLIVPFVLGKAKEAAMRDAVVVIGSGMMGSGIAAMSALGGRRTILFNRSEKNLERGLERAKDCIRLREDNELDTPEESAQALRLLEGSTDLMDALSQAFFAEEAITEDLPLKQQLFREVDQLLPPEYPICSTTSGLRITDIARGCLHPERTVTTHFWLPPHLIPLVEVVIGEHTKHALAEQVRDELKRWKKTPVLVERDLPGQLLGRIFQAILRESIDIVASGLATAEDVDTAIAKGIGMRLAQWGPLQHLDAIGLTLALSVQDSVLPDLCADRQGNPYLRELVSSGKLGAETGQGFYDWSTRNLEQDIQRRNQFIIAALKAVKQIGEAPAEIPAETLK